MEILVIGSMTAVLILALISSILFDKTERLHAIIVDLRNENIELEKKLEECSH